MGGVVALGAAMAAACSGEVSARAPLADGATPQTTVVEGGGSEAASLVDAPSSETNDAIIQAAIDSGVDSSSAGDAEPTDLYDAAGGFMGGTLDLALTIPPSGSNVKALTWVIVGPDGSTIVGTGNLIVSGPSSMFDVGDLPAGAGYSVSLEGTSLDGALTCSGSTRFSILPAKTIKAADTLTCTAAGVTGLDAGIGSTYDCATVSSVNADPAQAAVGSSVVLTASATAPNPGALSYAWSAPSGTLSAQGSASTDFTCTTSGTVTVSLAVSDGRVPVGATCSALEDMATIQVICE